MTCNRCASANPVTSGIRSNASGTLLAAGTDKEDKPMDSFLQDDLRSLLAIQERPCISLFQRTTRGAGQEDKIRWKNQVRAAEEQLVAHGQRISDAKAWLRRARELLDEVPFWQNVSAGLAAFLSPQQSRFYRLPLPFNEQLVIGDHFQIKPLLPLLREASEFFVLALSKKNVRLSRGNRHRMGELHLQQVPTNLVQALQYGDETKSRSFHTHTAPGGAATRREAIFHGQGPGIDSAKDGLLEFFQMVDRGLHAYLRNERAPLVIAAADFLLPIYRQANTYPHLLDEGILGHPDRWSARELRDRAWGLVEPLFRAERNRIAALYRQLAGTGRTAKDATEIVPAAYRGQI